MLNVTVKINDKQIYIITAVNRGEIVEGICRYDCAVTGEDGTKKFSVDHVREDGALDLLNLILERVNDV